jgi:hypothetical protein
MISGKTNRKFNDPLDPLNKWGNQLGEFITWHLRPTVQRCFAGRGIVLNELATEVAVCRGEDALEIDLFLAATHVAILISVKTILTQPDVDEHLERLSKFKQLMPRYGDVNAMGAVAAMVVPEEVARYAYRQGLFVLAQSGDSVVILNEDTFQPRTW